MDLLDNTVIVSSITPNTALEYKYDLTNYGLILNKDFSWLWKAPSVFGVGSAEFYFNDPKLATFFRLKWA